MDGKLHRKLAKRHEEGTLRSLSSFEGFADFASNDYLGLARDIGTITKAGTTGSRLISGNSERLEQLERRLSVFFGSEAGLFFNSGYDANLGMLSSIPQRGDVILYDEFVHASARDGIRLSLARAFSFKHNDVRDLERLFNKWSGKTIYVVTESLFSMGGDFCPLKEIVKVCKAHNAWMILDEAHAGGVVGPAGKGLAVQEGVTSNRMIRLITLGKAYGSHGAIVLCNEDFRNYLINFARSFIYTTALSAGHFEEVCQKIESETLNARRMQLQKVIEEFRSKVKGSLLSDSTSPIQMIACASKQELRETEANCIENKLHIKAIYPPTVPEGMEAIRVCLHHFNTSSEIDNVVHFLP